MSHPSLCAAHPPLAPVMEQVWHQEIRGRLGSWSLTWRSPQRSRKTSNFIQDWLPPMPAPLHKCSLSLPAQPTNCHFLQKFHQCVCVILFSFSSPTPGHHLDPIQTPGFPRMYAGSVLGPSRRILESMQDRGLWSLWSLWSLTPWSMSYLGWVQWLRGSLAGGSCQEERTLESEQNLGHSKKLELQGIMPHSTTRKMHSIV